MFFVFVTAPAACTLKFEAGGYNGDPTFLRPRGGPFVSRALPWVGVRKAFILESDGILSDRKPGDMFGLEMVRYNTDAADSCGNVILSGVTVKYKAKKK
ncbi:hypothetical protein [Microbaculum sp. FT89]|uniref:hypothetical protein n=1 Tax=Microbaculum sp. FT89 TaxID=3447298 RepID=UPI003F531B7A